MKKLLLLLLLFQLLIYSFCTSNTDKPKNIILCIGDGMGLSQITASKTVMGELNLDQFPVGGFITTHAFDRYVTDSAASSTAMATGYKSYNGAIGVDPDKNNLKTVLEYAEEFKKSTGLVATCAITHATPAAFVAHVDSRQKQDKIAEWFPKSGVDVIIGGGYSYFIPRYQENSKRKDDIDIIQELKAEMPVVYGEEIPENLKETKRLAWFLADGHLPKAKDRSIGLSELTEIALNILPKNENGFFLMIEGSQIDWAGHDNDASYLLEEMADFDNALANVLQFAQQDKETLVIVTADHETGGFALLDGSIEQRKLTKTVFATGGHTGTMVPLFAFGPKSSEFGGIHDNTFIGKKMIELIKDQ